MLELSCNIFVELIFVYLLKFNGSKVKIVSIEKIVVSQRKAITFRKAIIFASWQQK
jgi:hypothetical protein